MPGTNSSRVQALCTHPASQHRLLSADSLKWLLLNEAQPGPHHCDKNP